MSLTTGTKQPPRRRRYTLPALLLGALAATACVTSDGSRLGKDSSPTDAAQINYELGSQYLRQGKLKLARERLERAVEQDPRLAGPYTALALLHERTGDTEQADRAYRQAVRIAPNDANVQNTYAVFLCNRGRHAEGQRYFLRAADNDDNRAPEVAYTNAGVCALQQPDSSAAEAHFRSALNRNPSFTDALLQMAALTYRNDEALTARAFLQRYEAATEMTAEALLLAVRIERKLDNRTAAQDYARSLRIRYPDTPEAGKLEGLLNGR
ncbi:MAG: type IV pilus biogenesis/stability protein PilW [Pseudomonadota bacterium]